MNEIVFALCIGIVAGVIDVVPMLIQKLDCIGAAYSVCELGSSALVKRIDNSRVNSNPHYDNCVSTGSKSLDSDGSIICDPWYWSWFSGSGVDWIEYDIFDTPGTA